MRGTCVVTYLSLRSCDPMYRARESESKLKLCYRLFIEQQQQQQPSFIRLQVGNR